MKIMNLIKCEFIKNYNLKNLLIIIITLLISTIAINSLWFLFYEGLDDFESRFNNEIVYSKNKRESYETLDDSFEKEFYLNYYQKRIEMVEKMKTIDNYFQECFQDKVLHQINYLENEIFVLNQMIDNFTNPYFKEIDEYDIGIDGDVYNEYQTIIRTNYSADIEEMKKVIEEKEKEKNEYEIIFEENKYYKYIEYLLKTESLSEERREFYENIVSQKISDERDFRVISFEQLQQLEAYVIYNQTVTNDEFNQDYFLNEQYKNYDNYVKFNEKYLNIIKEKIAIIDYSIKNNIKHDISFTGLDFFEIEEKELNSKIIVNQIGYLSIIVIILVVLTSGNIITGEHSKKTEKILFTYPIKRWKILLSKFIYLIIHSYIIWFIALILLILLSGINYGFADLFTPKLIYSSSGVLEVNYLLYIIKEIFICSIPVISFLAILLLISVISLNTTLTIGISIILAITSPLLWLLVKFKMEFLIYTPLPYFDYGMIINNSSLFLNALKYVDFINNLGIIISIITIIICYIFSNVLYIRRDIKN